MKSIITKAATVLAVVLVAGFIWNTALSNAEVADASPVESTAPVVTEAPAEAPSENGAVEREALSSIVITEGAPAVKYDRKEHFTPNGKGDSWPDVDGNGCGTRDDILARDLDGITTKDGCVVLTGTLQDPYTGTSIAFERDVYVGGKKVGGNSQAVQIDHIIALSNAWRSGASEWTQDERVAFANDPENLLASDGPANSSKSDKGAADWMPTDAGNASYDCEYAKKTVNILVKYDLSATSADIQALEKGLGTCK